MGKRLSKIYTRTGDDGDTGLGDGSRVSKTDARVEAMGAVDELNACVGLLIEELHSVRPLEGTVAFLRYCQHRVFDLGGELSIPGFAIISDTHVAALETELDRLNTDLPALDNFILPGGSRPIAVAHLARSVCRRAERRVVQLHAKEAVNPYVLEYLNRLSDYLFVLARAIATETGVGEVLWQQDKPGPEA